LCSNKQNHLLLCAAYSKKILEYDPETNTTVHSIQLDAEARAITIDENSTMWIVSNKMVKKQEGTQFVDLFQLDPGFVEITTRRTNKIIISKSSQNCVEEYEERESQWKLSRSFSSSFNRRFNNPTGVTVDSTDRLIICDPGNNRVVVKRGEDGGDLIELSSFKPQAVAVDGMDNIFVAEYKSNEVVVFDREGNYVNRFRHSLKKVSNIVVMNNRSVYVCSAFDTTCAEIKLE